MRILRTLWIAAATCGFAAAALAASPVYRIVDLGVLPTHEHSRATDLNESGQVVGDSQRFAGVDGPGERRAFIWTAAYGLLDLGLPPGVSTINATGISNAGDVVGYYDSADNGLPRAFRWSAKDGLKDAGAAGDLYSVLYDINAEGRAVGYLEGADTGGARAAGWSEASGLVRLEPERPASRARAINDAGDVAVSEATGWRLTRERAALRRAGGALVPLGGLPVDAGVGASTTPFGINEAGQVVGASRVGDGRFQHAFLWSAQTGMRDLGTLPGESASVAHDVNRLGHVVGSSGRIVFRSRMFLWTEEAGMLDLDDLVDPADPLKGKARLDEAFAINDRGEIAGQALIGGQLRAVLLTPAR